MRVANGLSITFVAFMELIHDRIIRIPKQNIIIDKTKTTNDLNFLMVNMVI